jgi:hypothetical protein
MDTSEADMTSSNKRGADDPCDGHLPRLAEAAEAATMTPSLLAIWTSMAQVRLLPQEGWGLSRQLHGDVKPFISLHLRDDDLPLCPSCNACWTPSGCKG